MPDTGQKSITRCIKVIGPAAVGLAIMLGGFMYDILFAGIPYQDPTPELQARWTFHSSIAGVFYTVGGAIFLSGLLAIPIIRKKTSSRGSRRSPGGNA